MTIATSYAPEARENSPYVTASLFAQGAWFRQPAAGVLVLTDSDRIDFLQRMTSNNMATLRPGLASVTVLTSPTARIVQVFTVLCREDSLLLLPAAGEGAALSRHFRGQIFFLDKVKVQDASDAWQRLRVVGADAIAQLRSAGIDVPEGDDRWSESNGILAVAQSQFGIPGVELLVPESDVASIEAKLASAGLKLIEDAAAVDAWRVELGRPAAGAELTGDFTPLEVGMEWACSDSKGCYTGQEIIARQRTYDKVTRTLVGLRALEPLAPGDALYSEGREVGKVTSAAISPGTGLPIGLAVVKRPHNQAGTRLLAGDLEVEVVEI